ncbi:MAG: RNA methyltransferase [Flavobacteriaceae bacterium]|nr:MAG: RNA methyltransferase [Flavobacteriaceae bacterium]
MLKYRNLYLGINQGLEEIFFEEKYADKVISNLFYNHKLWGKRDRAFVAETLYDIIRWKRVIEFSGGTEIDQDDLWTFVGTWFVIKGNELPDWEEFKSVLNPEKIRANYQKSFQVDAIKHSIPNWLQILGEKELTKEVWNKQMEALNLTADIILRVNHLKTTKEELMQSLEAQEIITEEISGFPDALRVTKRANVFQTEAFGKGFFEVQDASSQLVARFLDPKPKSRVVDACAGAGGKTLHLANVMQNQGQIIALDIHPWKLAELKKRAKRNGIGNIQTKEIESSKTIKRLAESADYLLLDVPCTGIGVLKRNPDSKWKLSPAFFENVLKEQAQILQSYAKILKPSGEMVYSTCSIFPSENQNQVQYFLEQNPNFSLVEEKTIYPSETGFDGFYMAKMVKK